MRTRRDRVEEPKKIPIFTATKSLDVKYTFDQNDGEKSYATVLGADTHAYLFAGYEGLISERENMVKKNGDPVYSASIENVNIALAAVTVLYTDTPVIEGYRGEEVMQKRFFLEVKSRKERILSSHDFYTEEKQQAGVTSCKAGRDKKFNYQLMQRVSAFSNVSALYSYPSVMISSSDDLQEAIEGAMFHETFHHSEQAAMHYLSSHEGVRYMANMVISMDAAYLYGMTLDIFTQRMLCVNCNGSILGMQNSFSFGFLHDFNAALKRCDVESANDGIMLDVRVSAKQPAKTSPSMDALHLPNDSGIVHEYNPSQAIPRVLQAENKSLGTKKIINKKGLTLASCQSTFFVSSTFPKGKLEDKLEEMRAELEVKPGR